MCCPQWSIVTARRNLRSPAATRAYNAVGDAPLGYARWRVEHGPAGQGQQFALVDRLCVLKDYRRRGYAKACLEKIVQDVGKQVEEVSVYGHALFFCCYCLD